jgi:uncharacterized membrane protein
LLWRNLLYDQIKIRFKTESARRTTLDYLAVGTARKSGSSFGLIPYSSVGYKIQNLSEDLNSNNSRYTGWGLNKAFLGVGYKIAPQFSIGADIVIILVLLNQQFRVLLRAFQLEQLSLIQHLCLVNFNIGAMYQTKKLKKLTAYSSLNYAVQSTLKSQNRNISTVIFNAGCTSVMMLAENSKTLRVMFPEINIFECRNR